MKFQLLGDWPVGQFCIPAETIIDGANPLWNNIPLPLPMPLNARCLDQEAYDAMVAWYSPQSDQFLHLLHFASGIKPKGAS
jgi:hypothetical protein